MSEKAASNSYDYDVASVAQTFENVPDDAQVPDGHSRFYCAQCNAVSQGMLLTIYILDAEDETGI